MSAQLPELKRIAIFFATIFTASITGMAHADWSIKGLGFLGETAYYKSSSAYDINDSGQVVGWSYTASGSDIRHAFVTGPNGVGMTDLGILGGTSSVAYGINNSGQVVGESNLVSNFEAFIWNPKSTRMIGIGSSLGGKATAINDSGQVVGGGCHFKSSPPCIYHGP